MMGNTGLVKGGLNSDSWFHYGSGSHLARVHWETEQSSLNPDSNILYMKKFFSLPSFWLVKNNASRCIKSNVENIKVTLAPFLVLACDLRLNTGFRFDKNPISHCEKLEMGASTFPVLFHCKYAKATWGFPVGKSSFWNSVMKNLLGSCHWQNMIWSELSPFRLHCSVWMFQFEVWCLSGLADLSQNQNVKMPLCWGVKRCHINKVLLTCLLQPVEAATIKYI